MTFRNTLSLLFVVLFLLSACVGRRTRVSGPHSTDTGGRSEDKGASAPVDVPKKVFEPPVVSLVLGGAGIASFATIGLLKRFQEEGIKVESIVTTGWPTLFALGYGFMRSVHDAEWFAMRLQDKDFYNVGILDMNSDFSSHDNLSGLIENSFKQKDLVEARLPIVISTTNTELGDPEIFDKGDWKVPLLKTMPVPGIFRPYPENGKPEGISSLQGIDVEEAKRRQAKFIVAVDMYEDYFEFVKEARKVDSERLFRRLYLTQMKKGISSQLKLANVVGRVAIKKSPKDFSQKRSAILAGYKEAMQLSKLIKAQWADLNR